MIQKLNEKFQDIRYPGEYLSVDESMIRCKGRCSFKQYNPIKPIKRGYKLWCLADNDGYIFKFSVYTGKGENSEPSLRKAFRLDGEVVLKLTDHLHNKFHKVFFDNYFKLLFFLFLKLCKDSRFKLVAQSDIYLYI